MQRPRAALRLARELASCRRPPASACSLSPGPVSPSPVRPSQQRLEFLMPLLTRAVPWPLSALSGACQARAVGSDGRARWRGERGGQVGEAAGTRPASLTSAGGGRWPRRSGPAPAVSRREPLARPPVTRVAGHGPAQCPRNVCRGQPASRRPRLSGLLTALGLEVSMGECWGGRTLLPRGPSRGLWLSPAGEQCLPRKWRSRGDGGARARERGPGRGEACGGCSRRVSLRAALLLGPPVSDLTPRLGLGVGRGGGRQRGGAHAVPASASAQWQAGCSLHPRGAVGPG